MRFIAGFLLFAILGTAVHAETFYLKTKERFTGKIIEENEEGYLVKKHEATYSLVFQHHEVKKVDLYAVLDDSGNLIFPPDPERSIITISTEKLSDREFQNYLLYKRTQEQERLNDSVGDIRTILLVQLVMMLGLGLVAAFAS